MIKKISLALLGTAFAMIPFHTVNAEIFTYSLTIKQPVVAVTVTNTATEMEHELALDRANPVIALDTITVKNTGDVQTITSGKGTITRTDGGSVALRIWDAPLFATDVTVGFYQPGTQTLITGVTNAYLSSASRDYFDTTANQEVTFDVNLKFLKDFNAAFNLAIEFTSRAK